MIYYTIIETFLGKWALVCNNKGLVKIYLPNEKISLNTLKRDFPNQELMEYRSKFDAIKNQLIEYFNGKRKNFDVEFDLETSPFYEKVLNEVYKVPYGCTASYSFIANKFNNPKAVRAVGSANARNPIPIIIPCHRIISKSGGIGGYRGGLVMKEKLLRLEKQNI
jgi:O-6-methylguanine DNA methyltransferase